MNRTTPINQDLVRAAYAEVDHGLRIRLSIVGCILALVLVPAFWGLDWVVYPEHVWPMLWSRLICDVGILGVLGLLFTRLGRRMIRVLGVLWAIFPCLAISWMIMHTEGAQSPYYAGLNLVMIIVCLLMPWTATEVIVLCFITVTCYVLACILHEPGKAFAWGALINNLYFMLSTAIICITASVYQERRRFDEFHLRHELNLRNQELAEMDRLKSQFFANISHELRTPLTLIVGPLDDLLSRDDTLTPANRESLRLMRTNGLRLLRLINDLLEMVRLDAGQLTLHRQRVDLATFVPGIVDAVRHLAESKGLTVIKEGTTDPLPAAIDPSRFEKVLLNLLTNATKFTPTGGSITTRWEQEEDRIRIEVSDTGMGIPADALPHIFDRFHQVDGSSTRQFQGVGLGLAMVKELVEAHGGTLQVESVVDAGTRFIIHLAAASAVDAVPLATVPSHEDDPIARSLSTADRSGLSVPEPAVATRIDEAPPDAPLVLVVDDEPDMRRFLVSILRDRFRLAVADSGDTGLRLAKELAPDCVLLDMMLPGINGLEVLAAIRAQPDLAETRVIMLTARAEEEVKLQALEGGANDFLMKPFNSLEVRSRIANLLRALALQRALAERNHELETILARLRATEAQLIQSEKMNALGSLAAGLLHEINNPLNYALTAAQLAGDAVRDDPDLLDMLTDIRDGMERIRDIVVSLRAFAYPEEGSRQNVCDPNEIVTSARRFTAHELKDIDVRQELVTARILGAPTHVSQVLVNLLTNAARAIRQVPDRAGRIVITSRISGDRLEIDVKDNGVGIPADRLDRIFDPFYTTSQVGDGLGLGLSICHTIIGQHGGRISAASNPGVGTTVSFDLPLATTESLP